MAALNGPNGWGFVLYFLLTLFYGVVNSLTSPIFPDLKRQSSPALTAVELGSLFVYRGIGSMAGAFVVGAALDHLDSSSTSSDPLRATHMLLVFCLSSRIISSFLMPLGSSETGIGLNLAAVAFCSNAIYVCGSSGVSKTYGKLLGPRMSLMDAAFGLGGMFAPLLAKTTEWIGMSSTVDGYRLLSCVDLVLLVGTVVLLIEGVDDGGGEEQEEEERQEVTALLPPPEEAASASVEVDTEEPEVLWAPVLLNCACTFCVDVTFSSAFFWCFTYATKALGEGKDTADGVNSALWFVFTAVQFLWAYLQHNFPERCGAASILRWIMPCTMLMAIGMAVGTAVASFIPVLCLVLLGLGGGMNALFTAILRQSTTISGKAFGLIRISSACGNMFGGALVGWSDHAVGLSMALPLVEAGGMGIAMLVFWTWGQGHKPAGTTAADKDATMYTYR